LVVDRCGRVSDVVGLGTDWSSQREYCVLTSVVNGDDKRYLGHSGVRVVQTSDDFQVVNSIIVHIAGGDREAKSSRVVRNRSGNRSW